MQEPLQLQHWSYLIVNPASKEVILDKISRKCLNELLDLNFKPFKVPGTLQSNLCEFLGSDPYFEDNIQNLDRYEKSALLLICEFHLAELAKEGVISIDYIDTVAEIFLNGRLLGKASNAFIQHEIPIPRNFCIEGVNQIAIYLSPAMSFIDSYSKLPEIRDRVFIRRPAYNYGWDFAPRAVLLGIGGVRIYEKAILSFSDVFIINKACNEQEADIIVRIKTETRKKACYQFILEVKSLEEKKNCYYEEFIEELGIEEKQITKEFKIFKPKLWWPNGHGEQSLYQIKIAEKITGSSIENKFGIRKINLIFSENNKSRFIIAINGRKIWAKGANWVPTDALTNFSDEKKYRKLLTLAKKANFNMIRIWGGGVRERDIFYELCDELGIMIWHDFQFACSVYPEHDLFLAEVENEIRYILKRLRNHPSIVLWCGNNENEWVYYQEYPEHYKDGLGIGYKLHDLKERLCKQYDPTRPYWRSSPWSMTEKDPNSQKEGNCHDWVVWHGIGLEYPPEFEYYAQNRAKFITEFGVQSFPVKQTIDKIFSKKVQESPNEIWKFHNCDIEKIKVNLKKFGLPRNMDEWILFTQAAQAFAMKYAIEIWRSRKYETAGSLIWQYNEPWPTICWSLIDYFNNIKMSYWFVRRAFEPVIVIQDPLKRKIIVVNDHFRDIKGSILIRIYSIDGKLRKEEHLNVVIMSDNKLEIPYEVEPLAKRDFIWIQFSFNNNQVENVILPGDPIKINFPNPQISTSLDRDKQILTLKSESFAFLVHLPEELKPCDNFFNLIPKIPRKIRLDHCPENSSIKISTWKYEQKSIDIENEE